MNETEKKPRWMGVMALFSIPLSLHLHRLYGDLHWPGSDPETTRAVILDALHLDSFLVALFALILSMACLSKGHRLLGIVALVLSLGAVMNSLICF